VFESVEKIKIPKIRFWGGKTLLLRNWFVTIISYTSYIIKFSENHKLACTQYFNV
jgi:hypothetical protein